MSLNKKVMTRSDFVCPFFGNPSDLNPNKLPTYKDVIKCCFQERLEVSLNCNNKYVSFSDVSESVAKKIKLLYDKASIPTVSEKRIQQLIRKYHDKYYKLRKSYPRDVNNVNFKKKIENFKNESSLLFDVAACKCPIFVNCTCKQMPNLCDCPIVVEFRCEKEKKIPLIELRFLYLQRNYGLGKIG